MSGFAYELERAEITKTDIPMFHIGDTLNVTVRIKEGEKERAQVFTGVCIARKGGSLRETFTVRRIVEGEGVERVFPLHSPNVLSIEVVRAGKVRRAKLYYLRDRVGKATRVKERVKAKHLGKIDDSKNAAPKAPEPKAEAPAEEVAEKPAEEVAEKPAEAAAEKPAEEPKADADAPKEADAKPEAEESKAE